jgi:preprotein translocase subunit YajC
VETLFLPILLVLFVVLMFNSQRKRQRQFNQMQARLEVGKDVVTTAGLHARIVELDAEVAVLQTGPGQTVRWDRRAIGRVLDADAVVDSHLDETDVGEGAAPDDLGVDLNKSTPPTDEK